MKHQPSTQWFDRSSYPYTDLVSNIRERYSVTELEYDDTLDQIISLLAEAKVNQEVAVVTVLRNVQTEAELQVRILENKFGSSVLKLYNAALQLDSISKALDRGDLRESASNRQLDFSRILITMVDDVRVIVIHLVELLVRLRKAKYLPEEQTKRLAKLVLSVYTPLANKLGIWRLKWELEDLAFKYLNRKEFDRIARFLDERRIEREKYIDQVVTELQQLMIKLNITAVVYGRAKHLYGIWKKLNRKSLNFEELFDVSAVRILVCDVSSCYEALGAVHSNWPSINNEFDDYIAAPKANGYQSLHTAVVGPNLKVVEVQIRTKQMHRDCEFGVAAHWKYKEQQKSSSYQDEKVALLRNLLDWKDEVSGAFQMEPTTAQDIDDKVIFVFTPTGNVVELPKGATAIDFAYAIHTEVGHRCRGANVNGRIVPLTYALKNGDWVEIRTAKSGGPSRDWLSTQQRFVVSARARRCIRRWFKQEEYGRYLAQGKVILERELARNNVSKLNMDKLASANGFKTSNDLFTAIGMKELKPFHAISDLLKSNSDAENIQEVEVIDQRRSENTLPSISIHGISNLLTHKASCCGPLPGDDVVGYVTVASGITIHKASCKNIEYMLKNNPNRKISVSWEVDEKNSHPVNIALDVEGHATLVQEVSNLLEKLRVKITAMNVGKLKLRELGKVHLTVEVGSTNELQRVIRRLSSIDRVIKVKRIVD